jgi:hypothetical protein
MPGRDEFKKLSGELLERLSKEEARPPTTPKTALVGGVVTACRLLESLLREAIRAVAVNEGCHPGDILIPPHLQHPNRRPGIDRASAGKLAHALKLFRSSRRHPDVVASIVSDLRARNSVILTFIDVRNLVAKQGEDPALLVGPTRNLKQWVIRFRRNSGWGQ